MAVVTTVTLKTCQAPVKSATYKHSVLLRQGAAPVTQQRSQSTEDNSIYIYIYN